MLVTLMGNRPLDIFGTKSQEKTFSITLKRYFLTCRVSLEYYRVLAPSC